MSISEEPLKIICFGMGAIGTYIGGSLAIAGCDVTFFEKPEIISNFYKESLRIMTSKGSRETNNFKVITELKNELSEKRFDIALLAIKAFDTPKFVEAMETYQKWLPPILGLQNGVENEIAIESKFGSSTVIGASITTAVRKNGIGDVQVEKLRGVAIEDTTPLSRRLIYWFNKAGLKARGYTDRDSMKWSKLLTNLQVNATSAILNWSPAEVLRNPISYQIEVRQLREAITVMERMGLKIVNLPGTPVKLLVKALSTFPVNLGRFIVGVPLSKARGNKMPSLHIDLQAGRDKSEVEFLNGAIVRFGTANGLKTPVNEILTKILTQLADGTIDKSVYFGKPDVLLKRIEEIQ